MESNEQSSNSTHTEKLKDVQRSAEPDDVETLREAKKKDADKSNKYPHKLRD